MKSRRNVGRRRAVHPPLSATMLARVARRFEALADPSRLAVLQAVCRKGGSVSDLAEATDLSVASVSRHLARLRAEAFVERRAVGREAIYTLADETPLALCEAICAHLAAADRRLVAR